MKKILKVLEWIGLFAWGMLLGFAGFGQTNTNTPPLWPGVAVPTNPFVFSVTGIPVCKGRLDLTNTSTSERISFFPLNLPTGNYSLCLDLGLNGKTNFQFTVQTVYQCAFSNLGYGSFSIRATNQLPFDPITPGYLGAIAQYTWLCDNTGTNADTNTWIYESTNSQMWFEIVTNQ